MPPFDSRVRTTAESSARRAEFGGVDVLTWAIFDDRPVDAMVTTRYGGVSTGPYRSLNLALHVGDADSAVLENRRRAAGALRASIDDLVVAEQVHADRVAVIGAEERGRGARSLADTITGADALVTAQPGLVLCVLVADCAPIVLFDPDAGVLGCAHAGWRGALGGLLEATVGAMASFGGRPDRMVAGIGPTIAGESYEVGGDVAAAARGRLGDHDCLSPGRPGHFWFDLTEAVRAVLLAAGIRDENLAAADMTTGPSGPFFSARAEGPCGRFALLARIRP